MKDQPTTLHKLRFASESRRRVRFVTSNPDLRAYVLELLETDAARKMA